MFFHGLLNVLKWDNFHLLVQQKCKRYRLCWSVVLQRKFCEGSLLDFTFRNKPVKANLPAINLRHVPSVDHILAGHAQTSVGCVMV